MPPIQQNIDLSNLSDAELSQMLKDYGVNVGPINVATRSVYERKLVKLKTGQAPPPVHQYEPVEDDDVEEEDNEVQIRKPDRSRLPQRQPTASVTPSRPKYDTSPARQRFTADYSSAPKVESRPGLASTYKKETLASQSAPVVKKPVDDGKSIPVWVKLVALLAVAILVYLIYSNMEPQAVSNIPGIQNKVEV